MATRRILALVLCLTPAMVRAEAPMSAIDWLSRSVTAPVQPSAPTARAGAAIPGPVDVQSLDHAGLDAAGLLTPRQTGLPRLLWGEGKATDIASRITAMPANSLPALHELAMNLLLAEAAPPQGAGTEGLVFFARLDKLLALGALDQAQGLLDASGSTDARAFRRQFDIALLQGTEDRSCRTLEASPQLAPTYPARIFCLARSGDWSAAAVTLRAAQALGLVTLDEDHLMSRFLDPDLFEGEEPLPPPARPTPLEWRMFEAIGQPLPTYTLPLAFAHAELRDSSGWKARLEAAERLTRAGVLDPNQLLGLYTLQRPAASGGVWDRARAVQALDRAISDGDARRVAQALPVAWSQITQAELEVPFARLYAPQLLALRLDGEAGRTAFRLGLLDGHYADAVRIHPAHDAEDRFLTAIATGDATTVPSVDGLSRAVSAGFGPDSLPAEAEELISQQRLGEAVFLGMDRLSRGIQGDMRGVSEGISTLRALGLDKVARRIALQLMILERRG